jgi:iron complex transport system permease protein
MKTLRGAALVAIVPLAMLLGLALGSSDASIVQAISTAGRDRFVVLELRLPRVLLATIAGGGLALVGAAFQGLLRNPLAEPYVLGVSGGAAVGATTAIALGLGTVGVLAAAILPLAALLGGLSATWLVYWVAKRAPRGPSGASILLAGVMVNAIAASLITVGKLVVPPSRAVLMLRWLVGFVEVPTTSSLVLVSAYVVVGCAVLLVDASRLNLLALGDESAEALGVDVAALERRVFIASSTVVGAIVSVTGLIGFVGLVVPHAIRRVLGPDHRQLLPLSLGGGAAMLVLCDLSTRLLFRVFGTQLPVGALTALLGGPLFLWLLTRERPLASGL